MTCAGERVFMTFFRERSVSRADEKDIIFK